MLFGREVYERKNPNVSLSKEFIDESRVNLTDFPLLFTFLDASTVILDNPHDYYDFYPSVLKFDKNFSVEIITDIEIVKCNEVNYTKHNHLADDFVRSNLGASRFCFDFKDTHYIQNEPAVSDSSMLSLRFAFCNPDIPERNCKINDGRMKSNVQTPYISVSYVNSYVRSEDYENPVATYLDRINVGISPGVMKTNTMMVTNELFTSDDGWMLKDYRYISETAVSGLTNDVDLIDQNSPVNLVYYLT
eukprot:CAMPEP_0170525298 /NCGR_PEP_ID=MMETSP0209-20121228/10787_1 /TAXON_ID=665100 ORGANISM="Litonotus pictus, Strain P1" /NCGR_SAMPLE_ID=MMETSP0209 /ASSEMBLY_ACC=CAM_ASM_000301 /LENGTH=246 /DNA_ID=CAMNT_0010814489 /DNA_START=70 /DNA_END=806 /DNA_ORIENTATION=+